MMKKEKQTGPRTAPPPYRIRVNAVSCGHRLVYETLDSIDEVWRSQDPKSELSCFFSETAYLQEYSWRHPDRSSFSHSQLFPWFLY
jgi:hypothetical protein